MAHTGITEHLHHYRRIEGTLAISLSTIQLIKQLRLATTEDEKKPIRVQLVDALADSGSDDEREAIEAALLNEALGRS